MSKIKDSVGAEIHASLEELKDQAKQLFAEVPDEAFNTKPGPESWSAAECLEHLLITHQGYHKAMSTGIDRGRSKGLTGNPPYAWRGFIGRFLLKSLTAEKQKKFKAPKAFQPQQSVSSKAERSELLRSYLESLATLQGLIGEADGLDLARVKIATPITSMIRFSLGLGFLVNIAHDRRHLDQAERALNSAHNSA